MTVKPPWDRVVQRRRDRHHAAGDIFSHRRVAQGDRRRVVVGDGHRGRVGDHDRHRRSGQVAQRDGEGLIPLDNAVVGDRYRGTSVSPPPESRRTSASWWSWCSRFRRSPSRPWSRP